MADTIRDQICAYLVTMFEEVQAGAPSTDPFTITWSQVSREPIDKLPSGKANALGIYDVEESKSHDTYPVTRCTLRIVVEFHLHINAEERASERLNVALGEVQRLLMADQTLGGLAIDLIEDRNEFDIDGQYDKQVAGSLFVTVRYRHNISDPRSAI